MRNGVPRQLRRDAGSREERDDVRALDAEPEEGVRRYHEDCADESRNEYAPFFPHSERESHRGDYGQKSRDPGHSAEIGIEHPVQHDVEPPERQKWVMPVA